MKNKPQKNNKIKQVASGNEFIIRTIEEQKGSLPQKTYAFYEEYHDDYYVDYHDKRQIVMLKDKREERKYYLYNDINKELVKYDIDGKLLKSQEEGAKKCDFGIYTEDELLILVELKGADYEKAVCQILNTTRELGITKGSKKIKKLLARVVLSKGLNVPGLRSSELTQLTQLLKQFNGNILAKSRVLEETLSKIQQ